MFIKISSIQYVYDSVKGFIAEYESLSNEDEHTNGLLREHL